MTSKATEEKIQILEQKQRKLEKEINHHRTNIFKLKQELQTETTKPVQKQKPTPISKLPTKKQPKKQPIPQIKQEPKLTPPKTPKQPSKPKPKRDLLKLEQDFGKVWFVRLGIISLLTGLVFLSNFAYKNFIIEWAQPLA